MSEADAALGEQEIIQALTRLREEPYGTARSARTEELVEAAEHGGFDRALVIARFELLTAYEFGTEAHKAPVLFSRILKLYTDKPDLFDDWARHRVFWCFKWISTSLLAIPDVPLATLERWIAQMEERYRAEDKPLQAVRTSRYKLAAHTGIGVELAYELWATRPRDEFSDCEACEARNRGEYWAHRGQDARALTEWAPVLAGELTCAEEPSSSIARALLPLVRQGRAAEAASLHRSGYRATKGRVSMDGTVARHLEFLALTGNSARGLELLAENRYRFESTATPLTRLAFLRGVRVLLAQVVAQGAGQAPVAGPGARAYTAEQLLDEVVTQTDELVRRFDERNGTTHQSEMHQCWYAREPLTDAPLELGLRAQPLPLAPPPTAPAAAVPEDFGALLAEARAALRAGRPEDRRLWETVAQRAREEDLDDVLRAELADRKAFTLTPKLRWQEAEELLRQSAGLFERAGLPGRATAQRARAAWCAFEQAADSGAANWDEFDELLAAADALLAQDAIEGEDYCIVRHSRVSSAMRLLRGRPADQHATQGTNQHADDGGADESDVFAIFAAGDAPTRERFEHEAAELYRAATALAVPRRAAMARSMAARALDFPGRIEEALPLSAEAVELAERDGRPWALPRFLGQHGHLLNRLGRLDEAARVLHRALALTAEWPDPEASGEAGILMELGLNRMNAQDAAAAVGHLTASATRFDRLERPGPAALARCMLGQALIQTGRTADAIAVFESVLDEPAEARLRREQRAQLRLDLGRALMKTGEYRQCAEVFVRLADFVADWPDQQVHTMVVCSLAGALFAAGQTEQAQAAVVRARELHARAAHPAAVCAMLRFAAGAIAQGEGAEAAAPALGYLDEADAVTAAAEERPGEFRRWPETAQSADLRAQILTGVGRHEEGLAAAEAAAAAWTQGGEQALDEWAEAVRVAAVIEGLRLGRREQAAARLAPVLTRCRAAGHERAVKILTQLAENLGRG